MSTDGDIYGWLAEHGPRLVLLARQWVACHADAEDVVQTAFVRFWRHREEARDPIAYLYRIVRHTAMNHHRSASRRRHHEDAAAAQPAAAESVFISPPDAAVRAELGERVTAALAVLPIEQREVIVMRTWGRLTFEAIGQAVDIPTRTAQSRYRYGIEAMRQTMGVAEEATT